MKITKLETWPVTMRLSQPYSIAYDDVDRAENLFVRIETNRRIDGYGCAAPDPLVTGEKPEEVLRSLRNVAAPAIAGSDDSVTLSARSTWGIRSNLAPQFLSADMVTCPSRQSASPDHPANPEMVSATGLSSTTVL